jgi:chromosome segregation ATPase
MGLYDTGGFDTLGTTIEVRISELATKIDSLSLGIGQTRTTIETAGAQISSATEMVHKQLIETASSIGSSANTMKSSFENSSKWLINALKVSNETASKNAQEIRDQIGELSLNLAHASTDLQTANAQSSRLSLRLIWLTGALFFAAIVTAGATAFQAYETKRQADLIQEQLRQQSSQSPRVRPNSNPQSNPPLAIPKP